MRMIWLWCFLATGGSSFDLTTQLAEGSSLNQVKFKEICFTSLLTRLLASSYNQCSLFSTSSALNTETPFRHWCQLLSCQWVVTLIYSTKVSFHVLLDLIDHINYMASVQESVLEEYLGYCTLMSVDRICGVLSSAWTVVYQFGRRLIHKIQLKVLALHSAYTSYQYMPSLGIDPMTLVLLALRWMTLRLH